MCKLVSWKGTWALKYPSSMVEVISNFCFSVFNFKRDCLHFPGHFPSKLPCNWTTTTTKKDLKCHLCSKPSWYWSDHICLMFSLPSKKHCLLYLLEVSPPAVDCTLLRSMHRRDSFLFVMLALGPLLPSLLQNIRIVISPLFFIYSWSHYMYFYWVTLPGIYFGLNF